MIPIEEQIEMVKNEQKIDLVSGEFKWSEERKRPIPFRTEIAAWMEILKIRRYRHQNHLVYSIFDPRLNEDGYYYIWEQREIIQ